MKLAEALIQRADAQQRLEQLRERMSRSARVQEGQQAPEDAMALLAEANTVADALTRLIQRIHRTNIQTAFDATRSLTDALAERDMLKQRRSLLLSLMAAAQPQHRYGRMEIAEIATVDVAALQKRADDLARQFRELDTQIQMLNWTVELVE